MRIIVTGSQGQLVRALGEQAGDAEVVALGRPALDLADPATIFPAISAARPDLIVNAAAYTAVDKAESEPDLAQAINGAGAGHVAAAAARLGVPIIQISTDYVFDGSGTRAWAETDPVGPTSAYGRSKLAGEQAVAAATANHAILRTAWVHSAHGTNFVKTMLRLGAERQEVSVVADQFGNPTFAPDLADAVLAVARHLLASDAPALRGVFHAAGTGEACWADVAEAVFADAQAHGRAPVRVNRIATSDYPTPARRPANSRLNGARLAECHGIVLPHWRGSLRTCVARLLGGDMA